MSVELPPEHTPSTEGTIWKLLKGAYGLEEAKVETDRFFGIVACRKANPHAEEGLNRTANRGPSRRVVGAVISKHVDDGITTRPDAKPDIVLVLLARSCALKVWDVGGGTTYLGQASRDLEGGRTTP